MTLAAAAAIAAAAATAVVALAFALYAMVAPRIGEAGAAATVAVVAALLVAIAGLIAASKARAHHHQAQAFHDIPPDKGLIEIVMNLVRERPLVSAGAAVAVGIFALRNPSFVAALVRAFVDQRPASPHKD